MTPLARLWSWTGHAFILFAIGWAVFVRGGLSDKAVPEGVAISQGYWGLVVSLIAANALTWTLALYIRAAKRANARILVPPNTTFEEAADRNVIISKGTVIIFAICVALAIAVFWVRYSDSVLHGWKDDKQVGTGFIGSRIAAHGKGCPSQPCFAVAFKFDNGTKIASGVNEYILFVTDGGLIVLLLGLASSFVFLIDAIARYPPAAAIPASDEF